MFNPPVNALIQNLIYILYNFARLLDTPPSLVKSAIIKAPPHEGKGFSQYEAVFLQLADEHRTLNAFELQELLEACLPNGTILNYTKRL